MLDVPDGSLPVDVIFTPLSTPVEMLLALTLIRLTLAALSVPVVILLADKLPMKASLIVALVISVLPFKAILFALIYAFSLTRPALASIFEFLAMLADKPLLVCVNADCSTLVPSFLSVSDLV